MGKDFNNNKSWYKSKYNIILFQRNILLIFTLLSILAVSVAVFFVKTTMSSKSLEPFVIEFEEKTGIPTVVENLSSVYFTQDNAVKYYFINMFVQAANSYNYLTYKKDSDLVSSMSSPEVYYNYTRRIIPSKLGTNSRIEVRIKSIQFPNATSAQVRILTKLYEDDIVVSEKNEIIDMSYVFSQERISLEERLINPLNFKVVKYLITEEVFNY